MPNTTTKFKFKYTNQLPQNIPYIQHVLTLNGRAKMCIKTLILAKFKSNVKHYIILVQI